MSYIKAWFLYVGKVPDDRRFYNISETLPILQICPRSCKAIGDIYDFEFSLVGKIWDSLEKVKSPIVYDFPDKWKPAVKS